MQGDKEDCVAIASMCMVYFVNGKYQYCKKKLSHSPPPHSPMMCQRW